MLLRLFLLFTLVPVAELALLVEIGQRIGVGATVLLVLATGAAGAWLARREGTRTWRDVQRSLGRGELPARELLHGLLILLSGALLVTPGVMTDAVGFLLLVRPVRDRLIGRLRRWFERRLREGRTEFRFGRGGVWTSWSGGPGSGTGGGDEGNGTANGRRVIDIE